MTRDKLWEAYCKRNPSFAVEGGTVTMTTAGLKKLFDQTWHYASERTAASPTQPDAFQDFMDQLRRR